MVDASEATFYRGQYFLAVRALNADGHRTCKVGLLKVLCDQVHLFGNRIGIFVKIERRSLRFDDKMVHVTRAGKKLVDAIPLNPMKKKAKAAVQKPMKTCNQTVGAFHAQLDASLSRNPTTINMHDTLMDVAWLRLLDGGYPGRHGIMPADSKAPLNLSYGSGNEQDEQEIVTIDSDKSEGGAVAYGDALIGPAETAKKRRANKESRKDSKGKTSKTSNRDEDNKKKGGNKKRARED